MFQSSTTQPPKIIWPAARALAAEKTWLLQCLKALLRNLPRLFGQEGGLFQLKYIIRRQNLVDILTISAAKHISWQLIWAKKHISTPMQYCSLSSFIWKTDNATKFVLRAQMNLT